VLITSIVLSHVDQGDSSELASLRAQLHAALQALENEKMKNTAIQVQEEVFL